jgi:hypothetical protein
LKGTLNYTVNYTGDRGGMFASWTIIDMGSPPQ